MPASGQLNVLFADQSLIGRTVTGDGHVLVQADQVQHIDSRGRQSSLDSLLNASACVSPQVETEVLA